MPALTNNSGGLVILPDGVQVPAGETATVSDKIAGASGVQDLIASGGLAIAKAKPGRPPKSDDE